VIDERSLIAELDALLGPAPPAVLPPAPEPEAPPTIVLRDLPREEVAVRDPEPDSAPAPEREPEPPSEAAPGPREAAIDVLVVDDNDDYRKVVAYLLRAAGYAVREARDGLEALRSALDGALDLAIVDFDMPGLNGYELIQELRRQDETRKLPIIMLTGAQNRRHLREMGLDVSAFLDKPISNEVLVEAVARVLQRAPSKPAKRPDGPAASPPGAEPPAVSLLEASLENASDEDLLIEEQKKEHEEEASLEVLANDSPLVSRINTILTLAVDMGASDVHFEPQERQVTVRVRHNGALRPLCALPIALAPQVAARLKIMANLVITERRKPQDGQIRARVKGQKVEFRVSTIPSVHGEKIVMRVLGGAKLKPSLKDLALGPRDLEAAERALDNPHGLILVTGPTGSGKSTTLYTMVNMLNKPDVNIMTAEDPVEYELADITQVAVRPGIGLTFESVLRAFLRQDPDIMLVGEIRDGETAEIAVKAAITGHLVLSTLHTNSAPAAVQRLAHMGVAPYLLADSVKLVIAQRLVRSLCPHCRIERPVPPELESILADDERARLGAVAESPGCEKCQGSGCLGRLPLFEVMEVRSPEMRRLIIESQGVSAVTGRALQEGMIPLRRAALEVLAAKTVGLAEALPIMLTD
jgi:type IV pilus assembly protein PilB